MFSSKDLADILRFNKADPTRSKSKVGDVVRLETLSIKELKQLFRSAEPVFLEAEDNWKRWLEANPEPDIARLKAENNHEGIGEALRRQESMPHVDEWQKRQAMFNFLCRIGRLIQAKTALVKASHRRRFAR